MGELRVLFCTNCGNKIQVSAEMQFCFCPECGFKIEVHGNKVNSINNNEQSTEAEINDSSSSVSEIDNILEEANFYYQLSCDKSEFQNTSKEPTYYIKAQDILFNASQKYPNDYRIWWELSKPVDFMCPVCFDDISSQFKVNEVYFNKALDLAIIKNKKIIIDENDRYTDTKQSLYYEYLKRKEEVTELDKQSDNNQSEREEQESIEPNPEDNQCSKSENIIADDEIVIKNEDIVTLDNKSQKEKVESAKESLLRSLSSNDYSMLDATYFTLSTDSNESCFGVFKTQPSGVLVLIIYRYNRIRDVNYLEQSFPVKFDKNGKIIKLNGLPLKLSDPKNGSDELIITLNDNGVCFVNCMEVITDRKFVFSLMKNPKRSYVYRKIII